MDLSGEHSVQVVAAMQALLEPAIVLTLALLLVLLSVRLAQRSASTPMLAIAPPLRMCRIAPPGREVDIPSSRRLRTSLPSRAPPPPPDPIQRFRPTLAGDAVSG